MKIEKIITTGHQNFELHFDNGYYFDIINDNGKVRFEAYISIDEFVTDKISKPDAIQKIETIKWFKKTYPTLVFDTENYEAEGDLFYIFYSDETFLNSLIKKYQTKN